MSSKAAWEYCVCIEDDDGVYKQDGSKISKPLGLLVQKIPGKQGNIRIGISKKFLKHVPAIRYTIATFDPEHTNTDVLYQGGSSAVDVFPGTNETFGGEINGYGEITSSLLSAIKEYTIYYVYDGINPIAEYSPNGSILARYVYAGGLHIAKIAGADTNWYHCDALGSPRKMTNESGAVVWSATYYPFGEMTTESGNTHGFTGKEYDSEMGLNYFCQRYYDPEIGRFITLDPFRGYIALPQTQNLYTYCVNNPLKYIDPLGLDMQPYMPDPDDEPYWNEGGFGGWPGSMASYMRAHPQFRDLVAYNEYQSAMRFFFAKNGYFRTISQEGGYRTTTEYFFNSITNGIGMTTTTEKLGWKVASVLGVCNVLVDWGAWGAPMVLETHRSQVYDMIMNEPGLIVDPVFWGIVGGRIGSLAGAAFPTMWCRSTGECVNTFGVEYGGHSLFVIKWRQKGFRIWAVHLKRLGPWWWD